ncbi:ubiquinone biosynthesis methyltransferase UbiE [Sulfitobacter sp. JBTF-M27]|uniref:Ubiquinone biosynthesis methyltransferase UbiE n=1 Tax=Sulfitobacter sediminilitoris TaxID=2698830 RepID=A0A6P0CA76_9RHOB|nr:ubiquinone biosynthesis methyltransferase UbiE [Sulfitobacter sediminilitoris]
MIEREHFILIVKWIASILQIMGYSATAFGFTPLNIYLFLIGLVGWFSVGLLWRDKAIMLIHVVALAAMIAGLITA